MLATSLTPGRFDSRAWFRRRQFKIPDRWLATAGGMCCCFAVLRQGVLRLPERFPQSIPSESRLRAVEEARAVLGTWPEANGVRLSWFTGSQPGVLKVGAGQGGDEPAGHRAIENDPACGWQQGGADRLPGKDGHRRGQFEYESNGAIFLHRGQCEFFVGGIRRQFDQRQLHPAIVPGVEPEAGGGGGVGGKGGGQPDRHAAVEGYRLVVGERGDERRQMVGIEPDFAGGLDGADSAGQFVGDEEGDAFWGFGQMPVAQFFLGVGEDTLDASQQVLEDDAGLRVLAIQPTDDTAQDAVGVCDDIRLVQAGVEQGDGDEVGLLQPGPRDFPVGFVAKEVDDVGAVVEDAELVGLRSAADVHQHGQAAVLNGVAHLRHQLGGEDAFVSQADDVLTLVEPVALAVRGGAQKDVGETVVAQALAEEVGEDGFAVVGGGGQEDGGEEVGHGSAQEQSGGARWRAR